MQCSSRPAPLPALPCLPAVPLFLLGEGASTHAPIRKLNITRDEREGHAGNSHSVAFSQEDENEKEVCM